MPHDHRVARDRPAGNGISDRCARGGSSVAIGYSNVDMTKMLLDGSRHKLPGKHLRLQKLCVSR